MNDAVSVAPLTTTLDELQELITEVVHSITLYMLERDWNELDYRLDVFRQQWEHTSNV